MEFMGFIAMMILIFYCDYPGKTRKIEEKLKKVERKLKGDIQMSKILSELKNKKCLIISSECVSIGSKREVECTILDVDNDWIKFNYVDKNGTNKILIIRVESLEKVTLL